MKSEDLEYINAEFGLSIIKKKGKSSTVQMYKFNKTFEVLVCVTSMTEQLIKQGIATKEDIREAVEMGAKRPDLKVKDVDIKKSRYIK